VQRLSFADANANLLQLQPGTPRYREGPGLFVLARVVRSKLVRFMREPFNAISHLVGAILVAACTVALCLVNKFDPIAIAAFIVFGLGAMFMFSSSSAYHWTKTVKPWLQRLDHSAIFVMIAASYTPICLLALSPPLSVYVLCLQWGLALFGLLWNFLVGKPPTWVRLTLYLTMGWMAVFLLPSLRLDQPVVVLSLLLAGGVFYSVGVIFYSLKRPILWPNRFGAHEIWHLFVLGGAASHSVMMFYLS